MSEIITCPSGLSGRIRGMKVREERVLADRKLAKNGGQVDELLGACWEETLDPGPYDFGDKVIDWGQVLQGDRFYALLQIRALTYGPEYAFAVNCGSDGCRARIEWELSVEVANVQYFEGGSLIPNKSPGRLTFADVTLERGATQDRDLFDWFQDVAITSSGLGLTDVNYKRNIDIVQQDRDGTTLRRWSLSRAWPVKFVAGDWDNESDENVIESVTLTFDFFELIQ